MTNVADFDQEYEFLTVEVNNQYLGICRGGKQMTFNPDLTGITEEDAYWNNYTYWCFREVDISRYTGLRPAVIVIRLGLQETVSRNWLDVSPTPYLLDSIVKLECGHSTQDDQTPSVQTYDRTTHSNNYPYPHHLSVKCQEVECGALWNWKVLGQCNYPILSLYYFTQHYEDSMLEIRINEHVFGHCGPTKDATQNVTTATQFGMKNVRTCFEKLELTELLNDDWNHGADINQNPDDITNEFTFGIMLSEMDELDGIVNGTVGQLFINLDCVTESSYVYLYLLFA